MRCYQTGLALLLAMFALAVATEAQATPSCRTEFTFQPCAQVDSNPTWVIPEPANDTIPEEPIIVTVAPDTQTNFFGTFEIYDPNGLPSDYIEVSSTAVSGIAIYLISDPLYYDYRPTSTPVALGTEDFNTGFIGNLPIVVTGPGGQVYTYTVASDGDSGSYFDPFGFGSNVSDAIRVNVPEPPSIVLTAFGLLMLALFRRYGRGFLRRRAAAQAGTLQEPGFIQPPS